MSRRIASLFTCLAFAFSLASAAAVVALAGLAPMLDVVWRGPRGSLDGAGWWSSDVAEHLGLAAAVCWTATVALLASARERGGRRVAASPLWRVAVTLAAIVPIVPVGIALALR